MKLISFFFRDARELSRSQFTEAHPHPVIAYHWALTPLRPREESDDQTLNPLLMMDRLEDEPRALDEGSSFVVWTIEPKFQNSKVIKVGFSMDCDLMINDESLSAEHAMFDRRDGAYWVSDTGSSAGTMLNGVELAPGVPRKIENGNTLRLGFVELVFMSPAGLYDFVRSLLDIPNG